MRLTSIPFLALVLAAAPAVLAQDIVYDSIHNATTIVGTWSSGSQAVVTGSVRSHLSFPPGITADNGI